MSAFKNKIKELREGTVVKTGMDAQQTVHRGNPRHICSASELRIQASSKSPRSDLIVHEPVVVLKKKDKPANIYGLKLNKCKKPEPYVPLEIPKSPPSGSISSRKLGLQKWYKTESSTPCPNKEIEIHIEQEDGKNKDCLKKLFKKVHKLSEELAESEKERIRLQLELNNLKDVEGFNRGQEKDLIRLEGENYKLKGEIELLKNQLRDKNKQLTDTKNRTPAHIVKEVVVEKPVEVRVEVPRYVPGPEKVIEVPKYIESETMREELLRLQRLAAGLEESLAKEREINRVRESEIAVPAIVEKPVYLEKPVYVDRPIYIDRPYEVTKEKLVEVPIEVPYEVPVYVEKPAIDEEFLKKMSELEADLQILLKENEELKLENEGLKQLLMSMTGNLELLKRHNSEKNLQVEALLHNLEDYDPIKMRTVIRNTKVITASSNYKRRSFHRDTFNPTS